MEKEGPWSRPQTLLVLPKLDVFPQAQFPLGQILTVPGFSPSLASVGGFPEKRDPGLAHLLVSNSKVKAAQRPVSWPWLAERAGPWVGCAHRRPLLFQGDCGVKALM